MRNLKYPTFVDEIPVTQKPPYLVPMLPSSTMEYVVDKYSPTSTLAIAGPGEIALASFLKTKNPTYIVDINPIQIKLVIFKLGLIQYGYSEAYFRFVKGMLTNKDRKEIGSLIIDGKLHPSYLGFLRMNNAHISNRITRKMYHNINFNNQKLGIIQKNIEESGLELHIGDVVPFISLLPSQSIDLFYLCNIIPWMSNESRNTLKEEIKRTSTDSGVLFTYFPNVVEIPEYLKLSNRDTKLEDIANNGYSPFIWQVYTQPVKDIN